MTFGLGRRKHSHQAGARVKWRLAEAQVSGMQENLFVVYPGALWGWEVILEGQDEAMPFDERKQAIDYARAMAVAMSPAQVRIEDARGFLLAEWHTDSRQEVRP